MAALWEAAPCRQVREDVLKVAWFADSPSFSVHVRGVRPLVVVAVDKAPGHSSPAGLENSAVGHIRLAPVVQGTRGVRAWV